MRCAIIAGSSTTPAPMSRGGSMADDINSSVASPDVARAPGRSAANSRRSDSALIIALSQDLVSLSHPNGRFVRRQARCALFDADVPGLLKILLRVSAKSRERLRPLQPGYEGKLLRPAARHLIVFRPPHDPYEIPIPTPRL